MTILRSSLRGGLLTLLALAFTATTAEAFEGWMTVKNSSDVNITYTIRYTDDRGNNFIAEIKLAPNETFKHVVELVRNDARLPVAEVRFATPSRSTERLTFGWRADNGVFVNCTTTAADAKGDRLIRVAVRKGDK